MQTFGHHCWWFCCRWIASSTRCLPHENSAIGKFKTVKMHRMDKSWQFKLDSWAIVWRAAETKGSWTKVEKKEIFTSLIIRCLLYWWDRKFLSTLEIEQTGPKLQGRGFLYNICKHKSSHEMRPQRHSAKQSMYLNKSFYFTWQFLHYRSEHWFPCWRVGPHFNEFCVCNFSSNYLKP